MELMALYQEQGDSEKAQQVQAKISGDVALDSNDSFVSESSFQLPNAGAEAAPGAGSAEAEVGGIEKTLADIEVYLRYGLADKAIQALRAFLQKRSKCSGSSR